MLVAGLVAVLVMAVAVVVEVSAVGVEDGNESRFLLSALGRVGSFA